MPQVESRFAVSARTRQSSSAPTRSFILHSATFP
jgi:hypothetical protein